MVCRGHRSGASRLSRLVVIAMFMLPGWVLTRTHPVLLRILGLSSTPIPLIVLTTANSQLALLHRSMGVLAGAAKRSWQTRSRWTGWPQGRIRSAIILLSLFWAGRLFRFLR